MKKMMTSLATTAVAKMVLCFAAVLATVALMSQYRAEALPDNVERRLQRRTGRSGEQRGSVARGTVRGDTTSQCRRRSCGTTTTILPPEEEPPAQDDDPTEPQDMEEEEPPPVNTIASSCDVFEQPKVILARPTASKISMLVRTDHHALVSFQYGQTMSETEEITAPEQVLSSTTTEVVISGLQPNTKYYYSMLYRYDTSDGQVCEFESANGDFFHTQAATDQKFKFIITADTHWDDTNFKKDEFISTLEAIKDETRNDGNIHFMFEMGDTFMGEKAKRDETNVEVPYKTLFEDYYAPYLGGCLPLYFVIGNHDGENGWSLEGIDSAPVWNCLARQAFYANPVPDDFYSGNEKVHFDVLGHQGNYYSFEWGDALFLVLDPFWYTEIKPQSKDCGWCFTLGFDQMVWLENTLEASDTKFKFIFIHNLLGGIFGDETVTDRPYTGAGDARFTQYFEWGGNDEDGSYAYDQFRDNGWPSPVHTLLTKVKENGGVPIVFRGHDHLYHRGARDGVVYQTVPRPDKAGSTGAQTAGITLKGYDPMQKWNFCEGSTSCFGDGFHVFSAEVATAIIYHHLQGGLKKTWLCSRASLLGGVPDMQVPVGGGGGFLKITVDPDSGCVTVAALAADGDGAGVSDGTVQWEEYELCAGEPVPDRYAGTGA